MSEYFVVKNTVYPTLDISDNEDDLRSRTNARHDEAWNPKGGMLSIVYVHRIPGKRKLQREL